MNDVSSKFHLVCNRCGAKFYSFYGTYGSISHENNTDEWNINVSINTNEIKEDLKNMNETDKNCIFIYLKENKPDIYKKLKDK